MTDVLKSHPMNIEIEYRIDDRDCVGCSARQINLTAEARREDMYFKAFKEAEEHLRDQMNSWLTILAFFGVVLGLAVPLASYLLQRNSLMEERDRIDKDVDKQIADAINKVRREAQLEIDKAKNMAQEASSKAEAAIHNGKVRIDDQEIVADRKTSVDDDVVGAVGGMRGDLSKQASEHK